MIDGCCLCSRDDGNNTQNGYFYIQDWKIYVTFLQNDIIAYSVPAILLIRNIYLLQNGSISNHIIWKYWSDAKYKHILFWLYLQLLGICWVQLSERPRHTLQQRTMSHLYILRELICSLAKKYWMTLNGRKREESI